MAVGEHLAPQPRPQQLQVLLALVRAPDLVTLPQDRAEKPAVLLDNVGTGARVLTQTLCKVWAGPSSDVVTRVEVAVGQEAAVQSVRVEGPVLAVLLDAAQILAQLGGPLVAGQRHGHDHLVQVRLAFRHGQEGTLSRDQRNGIK